jgi:phenylacetic acid degradation operon negative regulatory protein
MPHRRNLPGLRAQDVVLTLFGDYLLRREAPVWTGSLITLLGRLGLSSMAARTALSRMARRGWLTVARRGTRSYHDLTLRGRAVLAEGGRRIHHPPREEPWDGTWLLVAFSIPESRRRLRDQLRVKLQWLGCAPLTNGLWITPHDVRREIQAIATELRVAKHVELFRGPHIGFAGGPDLVARCWNLKAVNAHYATFIDRWGADFDRCRDCVKSGGQLPIPNSCADPAECFRRRFMLVHEYRRFPLEDPFLPRQLLPAGWRGEEAAQLFERYDDVLTEPAERYVRLVVEAGDRLGRAAEREAGTAGKPDGKRVLAGAASD